MKHLFRYLIGLMLIATASLKVQAQEAFYIYQNDGHFDGFFYDEVEKIRYSKLDTLGYEHDGFVSQEIITADSIYRFMLTAIDSVGFVQPEIKFNPRLHNIDYHFDPSRNKEYEFWSYLEETDFENNIYYFSTDMPAALRPKVGDVFASFDMEDGFSSKIASISATDGRLACHMKDIDDITDIFEQFVAIEEYGYDDKGNLARCRMAGRPDLTIGEFPKKKAATRGQWEGDIFNFAINGYVPLIDENNMVIDLNASIEGKLHVKTAWNLSLFGNKYISVDTKLDYGIGVGFRIDGKIKDFFPGGIGQAASLPVPAACPLFYINIGPDAFLRGEAHVTFALKSPKLKGSFWSKLIINNWVPDFDMDFGSPKDAEEESTGDGNNMEAKLSLTGFVQTGMLFPLTFNSMPTIKKFFDITTGSRMFVGPKLAADLTLDLTTFPWDDVAAYNQLKNITLQMHLLDADYEVKANYKTAFSGKKEITLADGSISLIPPMDVKLVPEFENCVEYYESRMINGALTNCRIFGFKPKGYVLTPVEVTTYLEHINNLGESNYSGAAVNTRSNYYHLAQLMGAELDKSHWALCIFPIEKDVIKRASDYNGTFKVSPEVELQLPGGEYKRLKATPSYEFEYVKADEELKTSCDTIFTKYNLTGGSISIEGTCDKLMILRDDPSGPGEIYDELKEGDLFTYSGTKGNLMVEVNQEKGLWKNYNPRDSLFFDNRMFADVYVVGVTTNEYDEKFATYPQRLTICATPNNQECPILVKISELFPSIKNWDISFITDHRIGYGWHFEGNSTYKDNYYDGSTLEEFHKYKFDIIVNRKRTDENSFYSNYVIKNGIYTYKKTRNDNVVEETKDTFGDIPCRMTEREGFIQSDRFYTSNGKSESICVYFKEYIDTHPELLE